MALTQVEVMAKKKVMPVPTPGPEPAGRKPMVVQLRGSEEWKRWAEGLADKEGDTLAKLVERALRKWAKDIGHPDPPKR